MSKPRALLPTLIYLIDRDGEKCGYAQVEDAFGMVQVHLKISDPSFGIEAQHPLELSSVCARKLAAALLAHAAAAERDDQR